MNLRLTILAGIFCQVVDSSDWERVLVIGRRFLNPKSPGKTSGKVDKVVDQLMPANPIRASLLCHHERSEGSAV